MRNIRLLLLAAGIGMVMAASYTVTVCKEVWRRLARREPKE